MGYIQDLISKGYGGYQGWNDEQSARQDFEKTGGSGKYTGGGGQSYSGGGSSSGGSSSGGSSSLEDYLKKQQELQQQAIQPAIASLQSQVPTIQKNYATRIGQKQAEIAPLTERYTNLINQIKGTGQTSVNKQTVVTAGELGKRGIEGSSTLAGQEIANATLPIEQQTQSLVKDTGFAQEADLRDISNTVQNLGGEQTEREQSIAQAIAQLQAGGGQTAIQNAMSLLSNAQASESANATLQSNERQRAIENALAQAQLDNQTSLNKANINNINSQISDRGTPVTNNSVNKYYTSGGVTNTNGNIQSTMKLPQDPNYFVPLN